MPLWVSYFLLTLLWLAMGLMIWAWLNFNAEINDSAQGPSWFKYVALIIMLITGPFSLVSLFIYYFNYDCKIKCGLKFD